MAGLAALDFHGLVLEHERALLVGVALEADRVLRRGSAHLLGTYGAVHVVAIAALDQAFVDAVVERHVELSLLLKMAGVAELRLGFLSRNSVVSAWCGEWQEIQLTSFFVCTELMAFMCCGAAGMAGQAAGVDFLGGVILKDEDLRVVAAAGNVGRSRAVAAFASLVRRAAFRVQGSLPVRRFFPAVVDVFVAGLASLGSDISDLKHGEWT